MTKPASSRFTTSISRHVDAAMQEGRLTLSRAFEIVHEVFTAAPKNTCGHRVNAKNVLEPIPGALIDGKVVVPLPEKVKPIGRKLKPVDIESLADVGGNVDEAETHEVEELLPPKPALIRVAGEETTEESDEEFEPVEEDEQVSEVADEESEDRGDCA